MRDSWDNTLKEKLSSLKLTRETPSWEAFAGKLGSKVSAAPPKRSSPFFGDQPLLSNRSLVVWSVAAALLLLVSGVSLYHLLRMARPDTLERAVASSLLEPVGADTPVDVTSNVLPDVASYARGNLFSDIPAAVETDSPKFAHTSRSLLDTVPHGSTLYRKSEDSSILVSRPNLSGEPVRRPNASSRIAAAGGGLNETLAHDEWRGERQPGSDWSVGLYAYGNGGQNQRGVEGTMGKMGEFLWERNSAQQLLDDRTRQLRHDPPLVLGLKLRRRLTARWGLETALVFSRYRSSGLLEGLMATYDYRQTVDYLGIPVGLSYNLLPNRKWSVSPVGGLMAEMPLSARGTLRVISDAGSAPSESYNLHANSLLLSAYGGTEFSALLFPGWSLTIEPGFSWRFAGEEQPSTFRGEHRVHFRVGFGVRYDF